MVLARTLPSTTARSPSWSSHPAAASCSHRRPDGSARYPRAAAAARPAPGVAARSGLPRSSGRHRPRHVRGGTPAPATAPPACAPGPACTAPHRRPRTGIPAAARAPEQLLAESRQKPRRQVRLIPAASLSLTPGHTETHGHRLRLQVLWKEPEDDDAVAACYHGDTPDEQGSRDSRG